MNILIVEDDKNSADILQKVLKAHKYSVKSANSYKEAKESLLENMYALVLLDWNLGDGDGFELLQEIRAWDINTPVLMLTGEDDINDKVKVLDAGADDYLCKPYSSVELLARIRALLRRETNTRVSLIVFERLSLDSTSREVKLDDTVISLTSSEYDLLEQFMQNQNIVLTRYQLNELITKDYASIRDSNIVDVHIKNLRKKLKGYDIIKTVRGVGYTLKK
ncbi:response regulator transcription factor [bacterium]|nr:response regulator transcription factor [bacterium]MBU1990945.1 response regulator transcription factor [bacterium]